MSQNEPLPPGAVDSTACDLEPIHTSGGIQPFGCMLVLDESGVKILLASANVGAMLGRNAGELLGVDVADVLGPAAGRLAGLPEMQSGHEEAAYLGAVTIGAAGRRTSR